MKRMSSIKFSNFTSIFAYNSDDILPQLSKKYWQCETRQPTMLLFTYRPLSFLRSGVPGINILVVLWNTWHDNYIIFEIRGFFIWSYKTEKRIQALKKHENKCVMLYLAKLIGIFAPKCSTISHFIWSS